MATIYVKNKEGKFVEIPAIQGEPGESVNCVKVADEEEAIQKSTENPNNIYFW